MLWDVQTGDKISALETKSAVRTCGWSYSGNQIFYSTDKAMGQISELFLYTLADINKPDGKRVDTVLSCAVRRSIATATARTGSPAPTLTLTLGHSGLGERRRAG
jgi:hypothetical protein